MRRSCLDATALGRLRPVPGKCRCAADITDVMIGDQGFRLSVMPHGEREPCVVIERTVI